MGNLMEYVCPACEKNWMLHTGGGVCHSLLEGALEAFPQELRKKIRRAAGFKPVFSFQYQPATCHQCKRLLVVPMIRFRKKGTRKVRKVFVTGCPYCGQTVELLPGETSLVGPCCGGATLLQRSRGSWD